MIEIVLASYRIPGSTTESLGRDYPRDYLRTVDMRDFLPHISCATQPVHAERAMKEKLLPAIEALQEELAEQERTVIETKTLINRLCTKAGMDPLYQDVGSPSQAGVTAIRADTFYGKSVTTAAREFLEMRGRSGGPATTREVFEALKKGGYQFETDDDNNAMTGIRAVMRKNSSIFHRLPNGSWGLTAWYEKIKKAAAQQRMAKEPDANETVDTSDDDAGIESEAASDKESDAA